jgi:predicted AAA+ superfamily ATPase
VGYVHTAGGYEVDFLARYPAGKDKLTQVCASLNDPATRERGTWALLKAARQYPQASLHLISLDIPAAFDIPREITVHAAWDWLLQGNVRA